MRSIRLTEPLAEAPSRTIYGPPSPMGHREAHPWPARYWSGAWATPDGHIIRAWVDEVLWDDVLAARRGV